MFISEALYDMPASKSNMVTVGPIKPITCDFMGRKDIISALIDARL